MQLEKGMLSNGWLSYFDKSADVSRRDMTVEFPGALSLGSWYLEAVDTRKSPFRCAI